MSAEVFPPSEGERKPCIAIWSLLNPYTSNFLLYSSSQKEVLTNDFGAKNDTVDISLQSQKQRGKTTTSPLLVLLQSLIYVEVSKYLHYIQKYSRKKYNQLLLLINLGLRFEDSLVGYVLTITK